MRFLLLPTLALGIPLQAVEMQVRDIRLEVGTGDILNYEAEYRYTSGSNSLFATQTVRSSDYDGDNPAFISIMYERANLREHGGFIWGLGGEYGWSSEDVVGETFDSYSIGIKGRAGWAFALSEVVHLEITAEGQVGIVSIEDADVTASSQLDRATADGNYSSLGVHLGGYWHIKNGWLVGVSLRGLGVQMNTEANFDRTGGSYQGDISYQFWTVAASGGYRF